MAQHFLDSSALLKRYRQEAGSQWMLNLSASSGRLVVSRLAHVEVISAIVRRGRSSGALSQQAQQAISAFDRDIRQVFEIIELEGPVISVAIDFAKQYGLRAADALQLACATLVFPKGTSPPDYYVVSADDELNAAARAEGLQVANPNLHP
jgi:predicted nucleic acid-binding protein